MSSVPVSLRIFISRHHGDGIIQPGRVLPWQKRVRHRWNRFLGQSVGGETTTLLPGYQGHLFAHPT